MSGKSTPLYDPSICKNITETARSLYKIKTFSYHSECAEDSIEFKKKCHDAGIITIINTTVGNPDQDVELDTVASLEQLRDIARTIPDGHILLQTLRECTLKDNSLIRDDIN